ncbi:nickel pincer cofactor biosynthesis protein LarB [Candidatus Latescibacterota bacterium]
MKKSEISDILERLTKGMINLKEAEKFVESYYFGDLGFANVDHHRRKRQGFPEVIFGQNKTTEQVVSIAEEILRHDSTVLATRLSTETLDAMSAHFTDGYRSDIARAFVVGMLEPDEKNTHGTILVISAGTSDLQVATEAVVTARAMQNKVETLFDVGVAGIHRLLARRDTILSASCIIVVAGMEGALPSVVGGLVDVPVVACPTSVGYGASLHGLAALLGMLNSCASGVTVVNIDNGFGAAYAAGIINRTGLTACDTFSEES